jgi:hypothetical protein
MEKLIRILCLAMCMSFALGNVHGQSAGVHAGLVRVQGTLALGLMNSSHELRYFVYGEGEYLVDDQIGLNGAVYAQVGSSHDEFAGSVAPQGGDYFSHSLFSGPVFHLRPNSPLDVYVALQPGLHLTRSPRLEYPFGIGFPESWSISPSASMNFGVAYYASFFHLFAQVRALTGQNLKAGSEYGIGELRPTFGLGFNIF